MKSRHIILLIILATISGSSFIFTKSLSTVLGPVLTADSRIFFAGLFLLIYSLITKFDLNWRDNWKLYLIIGIINSAIPFWLYSYAALYIDASYLAIINSTAPLFASVFAIIWLKQSMTFYKIFGLIIGIIGVYYISQTGLKSEISSNFEKGIVLSILAALSYAISGIYIKKKATTVKPLALATGSQLITSIVVLPFVVFDSIGTSLTLDKVLHFNIIFDILMLSTVCSAIAYLIYFKLMNEIGPVRTLTVTFISPFAAMYLDILLNGIILTPTMLYGTAIIIVALIFSNDLVPNFMKQKKPY